MDTSVKSYLFTSVKHRALNILKHQAVERSHSCLLVEFLEDFFKHRGLHEFKKAEFANLVKQNIKDFNDVSVEIQEIISEIKGTYSPLKNGV